MGLLSGTQLPWDSASFLHSFMLAEASSSDRCQTTLPPALSIVLSDLHTPSFDESIRLQIIPMLSRVVRTEAPNGEGYFFLPEALPKSRSSSRSLTLIPFLCDLP